MAIFLDLLHEDGAVVDIHEGAVANPQVEVRIFKVVGEGAIAVAAERLQPAHHRHIEAGEDHAQHDQRREGARDRRTGGLQDVDFRSHRQLARRGVTSPVQRQRQHEGEVMRHEGAQQPRDDQQPLVIAKHQVEDDEEARCRQHQQADQDRRDDRDQALAQHIAVDDGQKDLACRK